MSLVDRAVASARHLCVAVVAAGTLACVGADAERPPEEELRPLVERADSVDRIRVEYGGGMLRTTSDSAWHGADSVSYAMIIGGSDGHVLVQVNGLDLSELGEHRWPVDSSVAGAKAELALGGPWSVRVYAYPVLVDPARLGDRRGPMDGDTLYDGYVFEARSTRGWFARRRFRAVQRGADRFDLRVRSNERSAWLWVRHRVTAAAKGGPGRRGPGISLGEWILVGRRDWGPPASAAPVRPSLGVRNWKRAEGPYLATWENVLVVGDRDARVETAIGRGELRAAATGTLAAQAVSGSADFSFLAVKGPDGETGAEFRFRSRGLDIRGLDVGWLSLTAAGVSFGGRATVNGKRGYRYAVKSRDGAGAQQADWLSVEIFSGANAFTLPAYATAGSLSDDVIQIRLNDQ